MTEETDLAAAKADALAARARFSSTLGTLQKRVAPATLARNAVDEIREEGVRLAETGMDAARRHPLAFGGVAAAIGVFLIRRPLRRLLSFSKHATDGKAASFKQ